MVCNFFWTGFREILMMIDLVRCIRIFRFDGGFGRKLEVKSNFAYYQ